MDGLSGFDCGAEICARRSCTLNARISSIPQGPGRARLRLEAVARAAVAAVVAVENGAPSAIYTVGNRYGSMGYRVYLRAACAQLLENVVFARAWVDYLRAIASFTFKLLDRPLQLFRRHFVRLFPGC